MADTKIIGEILGEVSTRRRRPEPTSVVIFGATGDLAGRKLAPALYNLMVENALAEPTVIIGVSRGELTAKQFADSLAPRVAEFSRTKVEPAAWDKNFSARLVVLDRIFGTFYMPDHMPARYGTNDPVPTIYPLQLVWPLTRQARAPRPPEPMPEIAPVPDQPVSPANSI